MEFWGFIYTKGKVNKDFFYPHGYSITNDYSINSSEVKKYYVNQKWIFSATNRYLNTLNLRSYIVRSETFAKILFSSNRDLLKFDYLEKGRFKKQLVIENGIIKNQIGFDQNTFTSKTTTEIFFELIKNNFGLNNDFIETKPEYFINERKRQYELNFWDYVSAWLVYRGMVVALFAPFLSYYLILVLIEAYRNEHLQPIPFGVYVLTLVFFLITFYLFRYAYLEIKNYLLVMNKVLDDGIITLPNNGYSK